MERVGEERAGKGGWAKSAWLSEGVSTADEPPLSRVNPPRAESGSEGDGTGMEASGSSVTGAAPARRFPFLPLAGTFFAGTFFAASFFAACLMRCALWSSGVRVCRSVFPVFGLGGMWLHLSFLDLHRLQGPFGFSTQTSPAFSHRSHCCCLALSQLRGWRHTVKSYGSSEPCSTGFGSPSPESCSAGSRRCFDRAWRFAPPRDVPIEPFRFLVEVAPFVDTDFPRLLEFFEISGIG